jgi:hypothetical protein
MILRRLRWYHARLGWYYAMTLHLFYFFISCTKVQKLYSRFKKEGQTLYLYSPKESTGFWGMNYGKKRVRRKIRLIEGNEKCRHPKSLPVKGALRQVFVCLRPRTPSPPPPLTNYTVYVYTVCLFSVHTGWGVGGRVEPEGRLVGQQFTKLGRKYQHDWLYLQSINSAKHLPQSPFTG